MASVNIDLGRECYYDRRIALLLWFVSPEEECIVFLVCFTGKACSFGPVSKCIMSDTAQACRMAALMASDLDIVGRM